MHTWWRGPVNCCAVAVAWWCWQRVERWGKEKQRGRERGKKINSHRHATLHQDCYCPERERERKGGMEGGRSSCTQVRRPQRDRRQMEIERETTARRGSRRKDLFYRTREEDEKERAIRARLKKKQI